MNKLHTLLIFGTIFMALNVHAQKSMQDTLRAMYELKQYDNCGLYSFEQWKTLTEQGKLDEMTLCEMSFNIMPYILHTHKYPLIRQINTMGMGYLYSQLQEALIEENGDKLTELMLLMTDYSEMYGHYMRFFSESDDCDEIKYIVGWPMCMMTRAILEISGLTADNEGLLKLFVKVSLEVCYDPVLAETVLNNLEKDQRCHQPQYDLIQKQKQLVADFRNREIGYELEDYALQYLSISDSAKVKANDSKLSLETRSHYALSHVQNYYNYATRYFHNIPLFGTSCSSLGAQYFEMGMPSEYLDSLAILSYNSILYGKSAGRYSSAMFKKFAEESGNMTLREESVLDPFSYSPCYSDEERPTIETIFKINGRKSLPLFTWEDVRDNLREHDVAVEFIQTVGNRLYALVIASDSKHPGIIRLSDRNVIMTPDEEAAKLISPDRISGSLDIYNNVWKYLLSYKPDVENIYFSPCTAFEMSGIEYALTPDGYYMNEKYNIFRLGNTREIAEFHFSKATLTNTVAFGGMKYTIGDDEWNDIAISSSAIDNSGILKDVPDLNRGAVNDIYDLPGSFREVAAISSVLTEKQYSVTCYTSKEATEDNFKSLNGKNVTCIIVSTHGLCNEKRNVLAFDQKGLSSSALLFSGAVNGMNTSHDDCYNDGVLTAKEISEMDLRNVELAVLSACDTGVGTLLHGFKMAGVRSILMSLQKVDDNATMVLMTSFFKYLTQGFDKAEALRCAQRDLRTFNNCQYAAPEYWASFILQDGLN